MEKINIGIKTIPAKDSVLFKDFFGGTGFVAVRKNGDEHFGSTRLQAQQQITSVVGVEAIGEWEDEDVTKQA